MSHAPLQLAEVHRLASLARLSLTEAEERAVMGDLERILAHVDKLSGADVEMVVPTNHAVDLDPHVRADEVTPSLGIEDVLRNAPERLGDGFGVPKIIE